MKLSESTILIVDDDEEIIIQASKILTNAGSKILSANDVPTAMKFLESIKPHLIITDIEMTPFTGFDFLKKLRREKTSTSIPAIILSSLNDKSSVYKAISLGAQDYIVKPIKAIHLLRKIRRALQDQNFLKFDFPLNDRPLASMAVGAEIHSVGDISVRVESSTCLNVCTNVSLNNARPEIANVHKVKFAIHNKGHSHIKGMYINELIAVPAGPEFLQMKRSLIK